MGVVQSEGLDNFLDYLTEYEDDVEGIIKMGIYDGAKVIADEVRAQLDHLAQDSDKEKGPFKSQIIGLQESLSIASIKKDGGTWKTNIGFVGYNTFLKTGRYPKGQPNILIARSIEKGTSYMVKTPFIRTALNKARQKALDAAEATMRAETAKHFNK